MTASGKRGILRRVRMVLAAAVVTLLPSAARSQATADSRAMNQPMAPFHLIGNIYYVGASDVTSYLIVTPAGDFLLDGGFVETAPQIEANIKTLGFQLTDVKFLLNSHAHFDHAGGFAELQKKSGAQLVAMEGDAGVLASGGFTDFAFGGKQQFPPVKPGRVIHDGDTMSLGGVKLTAHLTAGHTRGCTTWTMTTEENGKSYQVVFVGSASILSGYRFVDGQGHRASYAGMGADYDKTVRVLESLPCDVFLAPHGSFFDLEDKRAALTKGTQGTQGAQGAKKNPFVDPAGYQAYVARVKKAVEDEWASEHAAPSK
jgi:metallo-beta-lactamase class B